MDETTRVLVDTAKDYLCWIFLTTWEDLVKQSDSIPIERAKKLVKAIVTLEVRLGKGQGGIASMEREERLHKAELGY